MQFIMDHYKNLTSVIKAVIIEQFQF